MNTRRTYFIKKNFQIRFILKFCLLLLAGIAISISLLFLFSRDTLTSSFQDSRLVIENTASAILPTVIYTSLITLAMLTVATIIITLYISHKIAGPMFRFEKELKKIGTGDLTNRIVLRKKDQATDLAESINQMTIGLHDKVFHIQSELMRLIESAREKKIPLDFITELETLSQEFKQNLKT